MGDSIIIHGPHAWSTPFESEPDRNNGFPSWIQTTQEAIEWARQAALGNDLDSMQFGRSGNLVADTWLYNIFQIPSNQSPTNLAYDILFRRVSFFNSNNANDFTIRVFKFEPNSNPKLAINQTEIHTEVVSGYSGYTAVDQNVAVSAGYGLGVRITDTSPGIKPFDLNVTVWSRQT